MNKKGQLSVIAALLVAVVLVTTVVATYSIVRNNPIQNQPSIQNAIDETNSAIKQILGFTVGYYGSVLKITGNSSFAKMLALNYLESGLGHITNMHPEWATSFETGSSNLYIYWFSNTSYSGASLTVAYNLTGLGLSGMNYTTACKLSVRITGAINNQTCLSVTKDAEEPLINLGKSNFKFLRYDFAKSSWDLISPSIDPTVYANGTYQIDPPTGIDLNSYVVQIEDRRGIIVMASSFTSYTVNLTWPSIPPTTPSLHFVDNNTSDVDSSPDKGTHSNFTAQRYTDGISDTLTEANATVTNASYPTGYTMLGSTQYVSGSLTDLQNDDSTYMTFRGYPSATSAQTLYGHQETTTIGGSSYYLLKTSSADASGTTLSASASSTGRKMIGKCVYQLMGVSSIPASTWTIYYRAYKDSWSPTAHGDIDIVVRKSDGTVRQTIAANVANSGNLQQSWSTLSGTCSWSTYTVVDQTDYLEIDYYIHVTSSGTESVYLRIDDNTLALAYQTRAANINLPNTFTSEVEFTGKSNTDSWAQMIWTIDSSFTTSGVTATFQLFNYNTGTYPTSGDGFMTDIIGTSDVTKTQTITTNPTYFRDADGNWKLKVKGVKTTSTPFDWKADFAKYQILGSANYQLDLEEQWTNVDYNQTIAELCIYTSINTNSLDATGGYMKVGDGMPNWGSAIGTISFWIKWDTIGYRPWGQHDNMEMRFSGANLVLDWGGTGSLTSSTSFTTGKWYFIAITWRESTDDLYLYVGDQNNAPAVDTHITTWTGTVSTVGVTQNNFMASRGVNPTDGHGEELRYWNTTRTLAEIQSDYKRELTGSEADLRSYFKLNGNFDDMGFNNNDGSGSGSYSFSSDVPFAAANENLRVDVWNGAWQSLFTSLSGGWNNISISSYMTSATFTIRFKGNDETSDSIQDSWQIDASLIRLGDTNHSLSSVRDTIAIELLQNGTMRWLGQSLQLTTQSKPIPPIPTRSIRLNQTIDGVNAEAPFQIEDWASDYLIPLGLTSNSSVFSDRTMLVFLANNNVSKVTIWWNGSDLATQTSYAYVNRYFTGDNPSIGKLTNGKVTLQFGDGFTLNSSIGSASCKATFMRINTQASVYGSSLAYAITPGIVRDIIHQEAEWSNGVNNCPNLYSHIVLTLPANVTYYTYQLRVMFVNSEQNRTIADLCPVKLETSINQIQTENGTGNGYPIISTATGVFSNLSKIWAHHWSQFISGTKGAGIMFTDDANCALYIFDNLAGNKTGGLKVDSATRTIELLPVTTAPVNFTSALDTIWYGAVSTFDNTRPIYQETNGETSGSWISVEYPPTAAIAGS